MKKIVLDICSPVLLKFSLKGFKLGDHSENLGTEVPKLL
jgi:hypothetical protein